MFAKKAQPGLYFSLPSQFQGNVSAGNGAKEKCPESFFQISYFIYA